MQGVAWIKDFIHGPTHQLVIVLLSLCKETMLMKRFTIRALLIAMVPICILLALDAYVSSRLSNLKSELSDSPTSRLELVELGNNLWKSEYIAKWHLVADISDISNWQDRICFRRSLEVSHKKQTLLSESGFSSSHNTSEITLGLTSMKIERKKSDFGTFVEIVPNSIEVPNHAIYYAR